jgi:hypothetical protein
MAEDEQAMDKDPGDQKGWAWLKDNSAVIITVLSVTVVAIRLLAVSLGDPATAYAILQTGGVGTVLVATLVSTVGLLAIPFWLILALYRANRDSSSIQGNIISGARYILFFVALYMSPILYLGVGILLFALLMTFFRSEEERVNPLITFASGLLVAVLLSSVVLSPIPWLPSQAISVAGEKPFSGYVLSQANGETYILTASPEGVISVASQKILASEQCTPPFYLLEQETLLDWLNGLRHRLLAYSSCPATRYSQAAQVSPASSAPPQSPSPSPPLSPSPSPSPSLHVTPTPPPVGRA